MEMKTAAKACKKQSMTESVRKFIEREGLLHGDDLHLVAVSGGADSVCLLLVLQRLGYRVEAVHCNFHLRGEESNRDEDFVKTLCQEKGIALHLVHFDTLAYAGQHRVSIEMAARELRYRYFEQLRRDIGAATICVAHHQDDTVETILMNLLRGTGLRGLQGIQPRRGHIVRPLLCVGRQQIEQWLAEQGQAYVTDSTNLVPDIVRNHLRLNVMPQLRMAVPHAEAGILATARRVGEAVRVYDAAVGQRLGQLVCDDALSVDALLLEPSPESLLYEWLSPYGFSPATIESICTTLSAQSAVHNSRQWLSATHWLVCHGGKLTLAPTPLDRPTMRLPETGTFVYDGDERFRVVLKEGAFVDRDARACCLDAAKVAFPLTIRPIRQGDRFQPLGMKGSRLVSDFLTDRHCSPVEKSRQLVVCDANGQILWLLGHRPDHRFRVAKATQRTLYIVHEQN